MTQKYREGMSDVARKTGITNKEYFKKLYKTPEGKAFLKTLTEEDRQERVREYQLEEPALEEILAIEEEQEAYQEKKYEKKNYIDEDGVWIPRIVTFLIAMLLFWIAGKDAGWFDMFRYR